MRGYTVHSWTLLTGFQTISYLPIKIFKNYIQLSIHLTIVLIFQFPEHYSTRFKKKRLHIFLLFRIPWWKRVFFSYSHQFFPYLGEVMWIWVDYSCDLHWIELCRKAQIVICTIVGNNTQLWTAAIAVQTNTLKIFLKPALGDKIYLC